MGGDLNAQNPRILYGAGVRIASSSYSYVVNNNFTVNTSNISKVPPKKKSTYQKIPLLRAKKMFKEGLFTKPV